MHAFGDVFKLSGNLVSVTLAIGNTYEDDVRGNDLGAGHGG